MNVLFLTHRLPYAPNRGDRIRAYYLLEAMARFAEVSLFSFVHDDDEAAEAERVPFARTVRTARVARLPNLVRGALSLPGSRPLTHVLLDAPDAIRRIAELAADRPDVVVSFCSGMARFCLAPPLASMPFVLDMVDVDSAKWADLSGKTRWPLRWVYRREAATLGAFEARAAGAARRTLVVNTREQALLRHLAPDARVDVVENGIDLAAFRPATPPATAPTVVFCGVMSYYPNEEGVRWFAREVWPLVRARHAGARFIVVGADPTRSVRQLAADDPSIEVTGRVPAVQPYLWNAALSVAPLHTARGVQNKVLEALAAGLPVVTTPEVWDGLPTEASTGCLLARDAGTFARAVNGLLDVPAIDRRARAGTAALEALGWRDRLTGLEVILQEAINR